MKASLLAFGVGLLLAAACLSGCEAKPEATRDNSEASEDDEGEKKDKKKKSDDDEDEEDAKDEKAAAKEDKLIAPPGVATAVAAAESAEAPLAGDKPAPTPVTSPELQTYAMEGFTKISDGCSEAFATTGMAPASAEDYAWPWVTQAMLANGQYKVVAGEPTGPGEVSFQHHQASEQHKGLQVLVAKCNNGSTCNNLVAMLRAITRSTNAQAFCKKLPMDLGPGTFKRAALAELGAPLSALPTKDDAVGQCARLQACTVAMDPSKAKDVQVGFECQKAPHKVKRECAEKNFCSEVVSCLGS